MTSSQDLKYPTYTVFIINKFCSRQVKDTRHHSPEELRCDDSILSEYTLRPTVTITSDDSTSSITVHPKIKVNQHNFVTK